MESITNNNSLAVVQAASASSKNSLVMAEEPTVSENGIFRSMKIDQGSKTPYSDATQVGCTISIILCIHTHA